MKKDLLYYLSLDYPVVTKGARDADAVVAWIPDLPGCMTQGDTIHEAAELIKEAKELWIEVALENGDHIPEPIDEQEYSGKISLRMTKTLHRTLAIQAQREGVSRNQYIVHLLERSCVGVEIKTGLKEEMRKIGTAMDSSVTDLSGGRKVSPESWRNSASDSSSSVAN